MQEAIGLAVCEIQITWKNHQKWQKNYSLYWKGKVINNWEIQVPQENKQIALKQNKINAKKWTLQKSIRFGTSIISTPAKKLIEASIGPL